MKPTGAITGILALGLMLSGAPALGQDADAGVSAEARASQPAPRGRPRQLDTLILDATAITGNRELPKVLYIVPWKDSDLGEIMGRPVNSLLDEVLAPVDRDVFLRQVSYFEQLYEAAEFTSDP